MRTYILLCLALTAYAQKDECGCADCKFCNGKKPCLDLRQGSRDPSSTDFYSHYFYLDSPGVAYIDAESFNNDVREWKCTSRNAKGLAGTWSCGKEMTGKNSNFFGSSVVQITSETDPKPNFMNPRASESENTNKLSVVVCYGTPDTTTTTTATATTLTTTVSTTTNTIDAELARQSDKYTQIELKMEKQILESQNKIDGLAAQMKEMQSQTTANNAKVAELMAAQDSRMQALEDANSRLKATLTNAKRLLPSMGAIETGGQQGVCKNGDGGGCIPSVESKANGQDVLISAAMGKVLVETAECGEVDLCNVRQALAAVNAALGSLADLE